MERIGIDAGGSLIKIAYEEEGRLRLKTYSAKQIDEVVQWLEMIAPEAALHVTGGRAEALKASNKSISILKEFKCVIEGTKYLLLKENKLPKTDYLLVNIGTGTSFFTKQTAYQEQESEVDCLLALAQLLQVHLIINLWLSLPLKEIEAKVI